MTRWLMILLLLAGCAADAADMAVGEDEPAPQFTLTGAVAKGPFVVGSSVTVTPVALEVGQ